MVGLQGSLFDAVGDGLVGALATPTEHISLSDGAWVEIQRGWLARSDALLERLLGAVPWQTERRVMYDRWVDVPRLTHFYGPDEPLPDATMVEARTALNERYGDLPGGPLCSAGVCLYRDGHDSVAWHGDRIGRGKTDDTVVAIVSLGAWRRFSLRPNGGGPGLHFTVGAGDLLVMGGSCQRTWEHAVPKMVKANGPRISIQFRQRGVQ